jgi:hypothetical protein
VRQFSSYQSDRIVWLNDRSRLLNSALILFVVVESFLFQSPARFLESPRLYSIDLLVRLFSENLAKNGGISCPKSSTNPAYDCESLKSHSFESRDTEQPQPVSMSRRNLRSIFFHCVSRHRGNPQPNIHPREGLPTLLFIFLARSNAPKPAARRVKVVVVTMIVVSVVIVRGGCGVGGRSAESSALRVS